MRSETELSQSLRIFSTSSCCNRRAGNAVVVNLVSDLTCMVFWHSTQGNNAFYIQVASRKEEALQKRA